MANAKIDDNHRTLLTAVSSVDGETPLRAEINPVTGGLIVDATVSATIDTTGLATDTNQTNGSQKTQLVDAGGDAVTVTDGKLDVNATASLAGTSLPITSATEAVGVAIVDGSGDQITSFGGGTQYTEDDASASNPTGTQLIARRRDSLSSETTTDGDVTAVNSTAKGELYVKHVDSIPVTDNGGSLTIDASSLPLPTGASTSAKQDTGNTSLASIDGKITAVNTGAVVVSSSALPTGAATSAKQPALGTAGSASSDVITVQGISSMTALKVDGSAVTQPISDGGGSLTIDGTVAATQSGSWAVSGSKTTNNAAPTTDNLGVLPAVANASSPTFTEGNQTLLSVDTAGNMRATVNKIGGNAINTGNGTAGTGTQRVTLASDSTGQAAPSAASAATGTAIYNNTALSSTKQAVNASAGNLYGYHIYNPNASIVYVQLFNVASASVTVGTTAPTAVLAIPPTGWADSPPSVPIAFGTALTIAATTTATGSTAPATAILANLWYK
jgi:hypothetical protein